MKTSIFLMSFAAFICLSGCQATENQPTTNPEVASRNAAIKYDSILAAQYGADDYGMKTYVMALLKRGPNRSLPAEEAKALQQGHLDNINRMAEEGTLLLAGPFLDDGDIRGIYIFDVETVEEAEALTKTDPAIQAGSLEMELKPWYGSAALMDINALHSRLQKKSITDN